MRARDLSLVVLALALAPRACALDNGLGLVPPLAYSTWNFFVSQPAPLALTPQHCQYCQPAPPLPHALPCPQAAP